MNELTTITIRHQGDTVTVPWGADYLEVLEALVNLFAGYPDEYQEPVDRAAELIAEGAVWGKIHDVCRELDMQVTLS